MKRVERIFKYAQARIELGFEAFARQHPHLVLLYTLPVAKPGEKPRTTQELHLGVPKEDQATFKALRAEAFRTRLVRLQPGMDPLVIGRDSSVELAICDDEKVSATHAELTWHDRGLWLGDTKSKNGTTINGERIEHGGHPLDPGDIVCVGSTVLNVLTPAGLFDELSTLLDPRAIAP